MITTPSDVARRSKPMSRPASRRNLAGSAGMLLQQFGRTPFAIRPLLPPGSAAAALDDVDKAFKAIGDASTGRCAELQEDQANSRGPDLQRGPHTATGWLRHFTRSGLVTPSTRRAACLLERQQWGAVGAVAIV